MPAVAKVAIDASQSRPTAAQLQAVFSRWLDGDHHADTKPYTLARGAPGNGRIEIRFGVLVDDLVEHLVRFAEASEELRFGPTTARLIPVEGTSRLVSVQHTAWTEILDASRPQRYYRFELVSPTAFRTGRVIDPLPSPNKVFGHLRRRWSEFAPADLTPHLDLRECGLVITRLRGQTRTAHLLQQRWPGFVGEITVHATNGTERDWRVLDTLARLAPFAGIGSSTTFGMGRARYLPDA